MTRPDDFPGYDRQTALPLPHGWIQWKGTDVCLDLHCDCGINSHLDAEFAYYVRCPGCGQVYSCNGHIELVPLTPEETCVAESLACGVKLAEEPE